MKRTWVKQGDVLFNITGASIGRVSYYPGKDDTANVNQHVCIIRPEKEVINPVFLSYLMSMDNFQKKIFATQSGATRQAFNYTQIKKFDIVTPPLHLQQQFADFVQSVEDMKSSQVKSAETMDEMFNSFLDKAFRGELIC
jgi:type I restriction enzyme S subunit